MIAKTFLKLQQTEGVVAGMASRILAAFIASGQLTRENEAELVERSIAMAIKLAHDTDCAIESDDENGES
jgi:hypothetical protein